ncbi:hypothetical protein BJQ94_12880 [Cryobacterium sp. SO2]|nr:hypothetical protein [Cryobacterium sp. SO2]WEO76254.1 hypothetical protein BJQ94_12880 [Cryobacterium sp. SO2]
MSAYQTAWASNEAADIRGEFTEWYMDQAAHSDDQGVDLAPSVQ